MDKIVSAWQAAENAIVLACPSSQGGHYQVGVTVIEDGFVVVHSCPAAVNGRNCWHIAAAVEAYREWRWWEKLPEKVHTVCRAVTLQAAWRPIPVPGRELGEVG